MSEKSWVPSRMLQSQALVVCAMFAFCCAAMAQNAKSAKSDLTGRYEGTAKTGQGEVIKVTFELTEKDGAMSGMIRSDHGDFTITGGSHHGAEVTLEFDAGGPTGTVTLKMGEDKLSGTWSAGDDGGPVELKKSAAGETPKEKS